MCIAWICFCVVSVLYLLTYLKNGVKRPSENIFTTTSSEHMTSEIMTNRKHYIHGGAALHGFSFLIENKNLCLSRDRLDFFIYIYTAPHEFDARLKIRETWGRPDIFKSSRNRVAFFCGRSENVDVMEKLKRENGAYNDIILIDYMDSYKNLTHKGVMALNWMNIHCNNAKYYVKVDADIILNIFILKSTVEKYIANSKKTFLCHVWVKNTVVRGKSKFQVPVDQFPRPLYPMYCNGATWIFTSDLLKPLYKATFQVPFINVEDVYTSGVLPERVGNVKHLECPLIEYTFPSPAKLTRFIQRQRSLPLSSEPQRGIFRQAWIAILNRLTSEEKKLLSDNFLKSLSSIPNLFQKYFTISDFTAGL